ncbi:integrase family protein [Clostridium sp. DL-VIII]|uniref:tyrosine-type recombinase/integrase n=1 Tax=Clostridium sp. DL-VIII TaxID=641107 RepID=UPI00023B0177|nr:site-specific integrase [Clostridium sp. DL-VIII]EHI99237.1 integrase family protein [Clostridium sp. DL-VIII]
MVAGHLQEKKGYFYMVLNYKDVNEKRKTKWLPTGLLIKGNKKKAEVMLMDARRNFKGVSEIEDENILFSDFMLSWLEMMKNNIEVTTYASYSNCVKKRVAPYFKEKKILLKDLQPKHIQIYYQHELNDNKISANTVIHYHANIRKALQYAVKIDLIASNPADKVERPKKQKFVGGFYDGEEINRLFEVVRNSKIELAVMLAAFYGLRRSEIVGLKWDAIDFNNKSITIKHTVTEVSVEGKVVIIEKDRTKNKASHRTLPLVPQFEDLLLKIKEQQYINREICKSSYCNEYLKYIYVDEIGQRIKPGYITQHFQIVLAKNNLRKIRFHDLRHSCASLLLANGVGMKEIQEWLGHSDFSTTANIYAHLDYSTKIASANVMVNCLSDKKFSRKIGENLEENTENKKSHITR